MCPSVLRVLHSTNPVDVETFEVYEAHVDFHQSSEEYLIALFAACCVELHSPIFTADDRVFARPGERITVSLAASPDCQGELEGFRFVNDHGDVLIGTESDLRGLRLDTSPATSSD